MHSPSAKPTTTASIESPDRLDMTPIRVEADRIFRSDLQDWHSGSELNNRAKAFHDKFARQPPGIDEAKGIHTRYMREIDAFLRPEGCCTRIEYTGSTYEGVKVPKEGDDLEFDIMVIMEGGTGLVDVGKPGFVKLTSRSRGELCRLPPIMFVPEMLCKETNELYVNAQTVYNKFFGHVQNCINKSPEMRGRVFLVKHGPATQIDVYLERDASTTSPKPIGKKFYSVDIVPAFDIGNGRLFVAKQKDQEPFWWRESFSLKEKEKLVDADKDNGCRKQVFRILKVIRNRESTLSKLTSYHLKTALFREMDKDGLSWTCNDVGKRLMGVLEQLDKQLEVINGVMPVMLHYYVPTINLLDGMSLITIKNIGSRISRLRMSQIEMMKVLKDD